MKIFSYSEVGARNNNEDFIATCNSAYVLCDGVGGIDKGEVASKCVANSIIKKTNAINQVYITCAFVQNIIAEVQYELNQSLHLHPEYYGMGTTLCAVFISDNSTICAHIGDSRIYVIDTEEKKYWRTTDHSVAAELINSGIINENEARNHLSSNQITRAIQAIPGAEISQPDIKTFENLDSRHIIFLCSDGINEALPENELVSILCMEDISSDKKLKLIQTVCKNNSSDNNSALLIEFENEDSTFNSMSYSKTSWTYLTKKNPTKFKRKSLKKEMKHSKGNFINSVELITVIKLYKLVIISAGILIISILILFFIIDIQSIK